MTCQSYSPYVHFRGVTKWPTQACTIPSLFQPEDGTEGARKEYAFYCGKCDHAFGKVGCSGVAPSERPLCFPLVTGDGLDRSQEVHILLNL